MYLHTSSKLKNITCTVTTSLRWLHYTSFSTCQTQHPEPITVAFLVYYFASGNSHPAGTAPHPASPTGVLGEAVPGDQHPGLPPLWVTANSCLWTDQALDGLQRWPHSTLQAPSWTEGALGTSVLPPPPTVRVCKTPGQPRNMVPHPRPLQTDLSTTEKQQASHQDWREENGYRTAAF